MSPSLIEMINDDPARTAMAARALALARDRSTGTRSAVERSSSARKSRQGASGGVSEAAPSPGPGRAPRGAIVCAQRSEASGRPEARADRRPPRFDRDRVEAVLRHQ